MVFCFGMFGVLTRRNLILLFLSLELMLFGVSINLVAFGRMHGDGGGQVFTLAILTVAACEASLALALVVTLYRSRGSLDGFIWRSLGDSSQSLQEIDDASSKDGNVEKSTDSTYGILPKLTTAGLDPLRYPVDAKS